MAARNTHTCAELQYSRKTLGSIVNTTPHFCCVESVPLNEICLKCMRLASAVRLRAMHCRTKHSYFIGCNSNLQRLLNFIALVPNELVS